MPCERNHQDWSSDTSQPSYRSLIYGSSNLGYTWMTQNNWTQLVKKLLVEVRNVD